MEQGRLDQVRITAAGEIVEISWDERDALLFKLRFVAGCEPIIEEFWAAGASRPADFDEHERTLLRTALQVWGTDGELPDGLGRLLAALSVADVHG